MANPKDLSDLGFQPDTELHDLGFQADTAPETSRTESLLRGAAQGASLGFADEITAGLESAFTPKTYKQSLAESRAKYEKSQKDNPYWTLAGEILGGVAPVVATGGAGGVVKGAGLGAKVLAGAKAGALYGAGSGLGTSTADLTSGEFGKAAKDTAIGAGTGAVIGGVLPPVVGGAKWLGKEVADLPIIKDIVKTGDIAFRTGERVTSPEAVQTATKNLKSSVLDIQDVDKTLKKNIGEEFKPVQTTEPTIPINEPGGALTTLVSDVERAARISPDQETKTAAEGLLNYIDEFKTTNPGNASPADVTKLEQYITQNYYTDDFAGPFSRFKDAIRGKVIDKNPINDAPIRDTSGLLGEQGQTYQDLLTRHRTLSQATNPLGKDYGSLNKGSEPEKFFNVNQKLKGITGEGGQTAEGKQIVIKEQLFDTFRKEAEGNQPLIDKINSLEQNISDEEYRLLIHAREQDKNPWVVLGHLIMGTGPRIADYTGVAANKVMKYSGANQLNSLLELGSNAVKQKATQAASQGKNVQANFLNNFADAAVNKKKAMLFSASQNPDLRNSLTGEKSENKE